MIKVVHIINGLETGGAELVLLRLLLNADRSRFEMNVISLTGDGPIGELMRRSGIRVHFLGMSVGFPNPLAVLRLAQLLRRERPDIVQTWLQQSDLVGSLAGHIAGVGVILWNIRHSTLHPKFIKRRTRIVSRVCAMLSPILPHSVVCCSESARDEQLKLGYCRKKMVVIPNGVSAKKFRPDSAARTVIRHELGIPEQAILFGTAGRYHPQKDYPHLVKAASEIIAHRSDAVFALCGDNVTESNDELKRLIDATGHAGRFRLLGRRDDMPGFMAALDVCISASCFGEGFPNVVAEAMSSAVPCVVTDVGDSALIVGETGKVVPPERPDLLAHACLQLAQAGREERARLGSEARTRITEHFSLTRMVSRYEDLYSGVRRGTPVRPRGLSLAEPPAAVESRSSM
jgi:glycosyltransferase involved in cell wall biosynthesis